MDNDRIIEILREHKSPMYLYDAGIIQNQYAKLKECLPEQFEIFYSMKANPLLGICQLMKRLGSRVEVASEGELHTALAAGFPVRDIIFTSPGKTYEELSYAIESGIYSINIESFEEFKILQSIAIEKSKKVDVSIRINPDFDTSGASIKMSGGSTQFGIDFKQAMEGMTALIQSPHVNIKGIHVYMGTQILNAEDVITTMDEIFKMALEIQGQTGINLKFIDLGGGFGVPYFKGDQELDLSALKSGVGRIWNHYRDKLEGVRIAVESGRFLMAEAGQFLSKVLYCKNSKGRSFVICDGGSNFHANSAFLGRHIRNNFPMLILGKENEPVMETTVVGPLCTSTDVIGQKVMLPAVEPGDVLVVEKSGAYGLTDSPMMFLSHPQPAEVLVLDNTVHILREHGRKEDFIEKQKGLV
ncbi:MAG TPA: diaminopimelate decarboxylase [Clostridia bacterium]|nr:diaminopimelate decarboxylase [Clostridia bacterium]